MGGSMSSSSLYRIVATVEVVTSLVITIFGVNTYLLFEQQQIDTFQSKYEMILFSSIVAVVQSFLSILASVFLVSCNHKDLSPSHHFAPNSEGDIDQPVMPSPPPLPQNTSQIGRRSSLRRKAIAPMWISWTLISIACLLFVFIAPIHYCIQAKSDVDKLSQLTMQEGFYESADNKRAGICYSDAPEVEPIRNSLSDLYSFSFIGILFKVLFVLMVQRNWKKEQERAKKVIVYAEGVAAAELEYGEDYSPRNTPTEPKIIVSRCSTSSAAEGL